MRRLVALFLALLLVGVTLVLNVKKQNHRDSLHVALMGTFDQKITPENISTIPLYHLNHNLWETLITSNRSPGAARLIKVDSSQTAYTFELDEGAKFSNGRLIEPSDVIFSIKRLLRLEENGHFNGRSIVERVDSSDQHAITIHLKKPTPAFLFLLSTPEFGIVPKESVDPRSLAITDLSVTSGAYSLTSFDLKSQTAELKKNPYFLRHEKNSPEHIFLHAIPSSENLPRMLREKKFAFAEVYDSYAETVLRETQDLPGIVQNLTKPSFSTFLITVVFTKRFSLCRGTESLRLRFA